MIPMDRQCKYRGPEQVENYDRSVRCPANDANVVDRSMLVCLSSTRSNGEGVRELGAPTADLMRR